MGVFARSHVIGCVCLLTESLNQGHASGGATCVHLSDPVILKPSCVTECLDGLLKKLIPVLRPRVPESESLLLGVGIFIYDNFSR